MSLRLFSVFAAIPPSHLADRLALETTIHSLARKTPSIALPETRFDASQALDPFIDGFDDPIEYLALSCKLSANFRFFEVRYQMENIYGVVLVVASVSA
jgi:hypothetical protein